MSLMAPGFTSTSAAAMVLDTGKLRESTILIVPPEVAIGFWRSSWWGKVGLIMPYGSDTVWLSRDAGEEP